MRFTSGTFTITAGTTNALLHIPVTGDTLYESNETLTVSFANPVNSTLNTLQVLLTLLNDDPLPAIAIGSVTQGDG